MKKEEKMNFIRYTSAAMVLGALVACGGSQNAAPVVEPATKPAPVQPKVSLDSLTDRYSYALGMDLGKAIANINVPVKLDILIAAIQDEVDPARPVMMSDSASESALQDLLLSMQKQKEADERAAAAKALEDQATFLAKNIQDTSVKTTPKGVQYRIIKEGSGITPKASDKVQVHYIGALLDGTQFDNSVARGEPLEFPVSAVIEGWQDLLMNMKEGSKVKAWIPSALAYGENGVPPTIPGNALLIFEVELLKVYAEVPAADSVAADTTATPAAVQDSSITAVPAATTSTATEAPKQEAAPAEKVEATKEETPAAQPGKAK